MRQWRRQTLKTDNAKNTVWRGQSLEKQPVAAIQIVERGETATTPGGQAASVIGRASSGCVDYVSLPHATSILLRTLTTGGVKSQTSSTTFENQSRDCHPPPWPKTLVLYSKRCANDNPSPTPETGWRHSDLTVAPLPKYRPRRRCREPAAASAFSAAAKTSTKMPPTCLSRRPTPSRCRSRVSTCKTALRLQAPSLTLCACADRSRCRKGL